MYFKAMVDEKSSCCSCSSRCHTKWNFLLENAFGKLGSFIAVHPVKIMIVCIVVNLLLAIGIINIEAENDVVNLYTPIDSQAIQDRALIRILYGDPTQKNFRPYQLADFGLYGDVMIISRNKSTIMDQAYVDEINNINNIIQNTITVSDASGQTYLYSDLSAGSNAEEGVPGSVILSNAFQADFIISNITYPFYGNSILSPYLAKASSRNNMLNSAIGVRIGYYLRQNNASVVELSKKWEKAFVSKLENLQTNLTEIAYTASDSLGTELEKNINGDIKFFTVTLTLMMTYASIASLTTNCNNVANRMNLGFAGVIAPVLAITSAFGFVSAIGVEFTNIVGVLPFLVVGMYPLMQSSLRKMVLFTDSFLQVLWSSLQRSGLPICTFLCFIPIVKPFLYTGFDHG
jgi:predicted RND superfamily exporter protein